VTTKIVYHFEWDEEKARANLSKHKVGFRLATGVFRDPLALTIYDTEHSENEERWITLGLAEDGQYLVVVHTHELIAATEVRIRIISARKADRQEIRDYENAPR
jgi:hypothetical protein